MKVLKSLKFEVTDGAKGNHKVFKHPDIPHFTGGHFDCGHGKSPQVKKFYIGDVRKTLERYKEELEQLK